MNITRELARFIVNLEYKDLPDNVVAQAKLNILNIIGKAFAGYKVSLAKPYLNLAKGMGGGRADATVIGDGSKIACAPAAFANSSLATMLDYDDTLHWALVHPGNSAVSAALATGEGRKVNGEDFITAVVLGYEIAGRISLAIQPTMERFPKVWGLGNQAFAASPSAGKLLGLNEDQMTSALGFTGTYAVVPSAWKYLGEGTRPMREVKMAWGWSCMVGTFSALAAKEGLRMLQPSNILEGETGWYIMHGSDKCEFHKMTEELGTRWDILTTAIKAYSACYLIFGPCDAAQEALKQEKVDPDDVEKVNVRGGQWIKDRLSDSDPQGVVDAQFSTQWAIAMVILGIPPGPEWCSEERLNDPKARALCKKVLVELDPDADRAWLEEGKSINTVEIITKKGKKLTGFVDHPKGELPNPFTPDEIRDTYRRLAAYVLKPKQIEELLTMVEDLEKLDDVSRLAALLYPRR
ncbi:MAG: MmgE/PrpD family protein [Rubrivivax sp.]|nr:MmgE/PrpD family protein [Rubrivivax sp.]